MFLLATGSANVFVTLDTMRSLSHRGPFKCCRWGRRSKIHVIAQIIL